jgi:hypothetical protein
MSHFSVIVCIDNPERLDELMGRWDENREVEPYRDYEEGGPQGHWAVDSLREHAGLDPDDTTLTWAQVAAAYNERYGDEEQPMLVDESGRAYAMSTRNPEAKWDYWRIGGRWGGYFRYREGSRRQVMLPGSGWDSPKSISPRSCDGGQKRFLDLETTRKDSMVEALKQYRDWKEVVGDTPEAMPWSAFRDNISPESGYTIDRAREEYHSQPRVQAYQNTDFRWMDDPIGHFDRPEKIYVEMEGRARAVPGYATITADGRWMAPGRMGWFGFSTDEHGDRIGYLEAANAYIDALDDDIYLIALDCHI